MIDVFLGVVELRGILIFSLNFSRFKNVYIGCVLLIIMRNNRSILIQGPFVFSENIGALHGVGKKAFCMHTVPCNDGHI